MSFITVNINLNSAKSRLQRFINYFEGDGLKKTLEDVGDDQLDEHLKRFDYFKVDYRNKPLMGLMESYYRWKVIFTGIADQNIGVLTGKMRAMTFTRVEGKSLFIENFVRNDKGRPYAHHFQKHRPIFGFSEQGIKKAKLIIQNAIGKFTI